LLVIIMFVIIFFFILPYSKKEKKKKIKKNQEKKFVYFFVLNDLFFFVLGWLYIKRHAQKASKVQKVLNTIEKQITLLYIASTFHLLCHQIIENAFSICLWSQHNPSLISMQEWGWVFLSIFIIAIPIH
jgi:quinol-cytochrome oxidoreductase complex cytochrome b subunit